MNGSPSRQYILMPCKTKDGWQVDHSVVYRYDGEQFVLSPELSDAIIKNGMDWLCKNEDLTNFEDDICNEIAKNSDHISIQDVQVYVGSRNLPPRPGLN